MPDIYGHFSRVFFFVCVHHIGLAYILSDLRTCTQRMFARNISVNGSHFGLSPRLKFIPQNDWTGGGGGGENWCEYDVCANASLNVQVRPWPVSHYDLKSFWL